MEEWEEASEMGQIVTALDQQDGFVHLSSATQLKHDPVFVFLQTKRKVVLVEINESDISRRALPTRYAGKRGGEFAHFYGELSTDKISQSWYLDRSAFSLPEEVMLEAEQN